MVPEPPVTRTRRPRTCERSLMGLPPAAGRSLPVAASSSPGPAPYLEYDTRRPVDSGRRCARDPSGSSSTNHARTQRPDDLSSQTCRQACPEALLGEPRPEELLPQHRLRPRRRRGRADPRHRRRPGLLQRPPRVGRQRRRPVDHQGRAARPRAHRGLAPGRGRPADQHAEGRRPPHRGPGRAAEPARRRSSASSSCAIALERIIDTRIQADLATTEGDHGRRRRHRRPAARGGDDRRRRATPG